ncbi:MAG TPA: urea ABC transporter permease subunit UrtC, partial [Alcanivorax sp.]|nr:urea ABC transporter permease subunit UrtC [Alcanivorax sp.]
RATLYGAVIGAVLVNYAKTVFTGVMPEAWLFALGGLFVAVTVFLPQGLVGLVSQRWAAIQKQFQKKETGNDNHTPAEGETP